MSYIDACLSFAQLRQKGVVSIHPVYCDGTIVYNSEFLDNVIKNYVMSRNSLISID